MIVPPAVFVNVKADNAAVVARRTDAFTSSPCATAQSVSMLLTANEEGEWAFHCHLLYHMASGMMTSITVEK